MQKVYVTNLNRGPKLPVQLTSFYDNEQVALEAIKAAVSSLNTSRMRYVIDMTPFDLHRYMCVYYHTVDESPKYIDNRRTQVITFV